MTKNTASGFSLCTLNLSQQSRVIWAGFERQTFKLWIRHLTTESGGFFQMFPKSVSRLKICRWSKFVEILLPQRLWAQRYKTFYICNLRMFVISSGVLSLARLSTLLYCLWVRLGAYPRVEHRKDAPLRLAVALLANNRLGWSGFQRANTLAYYKNL